MKIPNHFSEEAWHLLAATMSVRIWRSVSKSTNVGTRKVVTIRKDHTFPGDDSWFRAVLGPRQRFDSQEPITPLIIH